jgi:hypothetical protein
LTFNKLHGIISQENELLNNLNKLCNNVNIIVLSTTTMAVSITVPGNFEELHPRFEKVNLFVTWDWSLGASHNLVYLNPVSALQKCAYTGVKVEQTNT